MAQAAVIPNALIPLDPGGRSRPMFAGLGRTFREAAGKATKDIKTTGMFLRDHWKTVATGMAMSAGTKIVLREGLTFLGAGAIAGGVIVAVDLAKDFKKARASSKDNLTAIQSLVTWKNGRKYGVKFVGMTLAGGLGAELADRLLDQFENAKTAVEAAAAIQLAEMTSQNVDTLERMAAAVSTSPATVTAQIVEEAGDPGNVAPKVIPAAGVTEEYFSPDELAALHGAPVNVGDATILEDSPAPAEKPEGPDPVIAEKFAAAPEVPAETILAETVAAPPETPADAFAFEAAPEASDIGAVGGSTLEDFRSAAFADAREWVSGVGADMAQGWDDFMQSVEPVELPSFDGFVDGIRSFIENFAEGFKKIFSLEFLTGASGPDAFSPPENNFVMAEAGAAEMEAPDYLRAPEPVAQTEFAAAAPEIAEPVMAENTAPEETVAAAMEDAPPAGFAFDPGLAMEDQLKALAESGQLGERGQYTIRFAMKGDEWALNEIADGLRNQRFGFENISGGKEFANTILEDLSNQDYTEAQDDLAYLKEFGKHGVVKDLEGADALVEKAGMWYDPAAADDVLAGATAPAMECMEIPSETADASFICNKPDLFSEGDNITIAGLDGTRMEINLGNEEIAQNLTKGIQRDIVDPEGERDTLAKFFEDVTSPQQPPIHMAGWGPAPAMAVGGGP